MSIIIIISVWQLRYNDYKVLKESTMYEIVFIGNRYSLCMYGCICIIIMGANEFK